MAQQSVQLEHEAQRARTQLEGTIEELRSHISPSQFMDQLVDYARDGAAVEFARNLGRDIRDNALPVALLSAGFAWLMMRSGSQPQAGARDFAESAREMTGRTMAEAEEKVAGAGGKAQERAAERAGPGERAADGIGERLISTVAASGDKLAEAGARASEAAGEAFAKGKDTAEASLRSAAGSAGETGKLARERASSLMRSGSETGRRFLQFCQDQPMVLAGLGIAAGAVVGALFPATETENRLMGEASDRLKQAGAEQYDKAKGTVAQALAGPSQEVSEQAATAVDELGAAAGAPH